MLIFLGVRERESADLVLVAVARILAKGVNLRPGTRGHDYRVPGFSTRSFYAIFSRHIGEAGRECYRVCAGQAKALTTADTSGGVASALACDFHYLVAVLFGLDSAFHRLL